MITDLLKAVPSNGIRHVNFFNGRVLTAEDLQEEQKAHRTRAERLGTAIGEGIVHGLDVTSTTTSATENQNGSSGGNRPAVLIQPGLALTRSGKALELSAPLTVRIVPEDDVPFGGDGLFVPCVPSTAGGMPINGGIYLLVMCPAEGKSGLAPRVGLNEGTARTCESRFIVEGLQFRLVHLDVQSDSLVPSALRTRLRTLMGQTSLTAAERSLLRNLVAHWCLGTAQTATLPGDLFGLFESATNDLAYGPLDVLRSRALTSPTRLSSCDVPLAVLHWQSGAIAFLDMWSVRREVHQTRAAGKAPLAVLDRRRAEARAALFQFQHHVGTIAPPGTAQSALNAIRADQYFRYLPALGVIPEQAGSTSGFGYLSFFQGLTYRADPPTFIEGARLRWLMQMSLDFEVIDLEAKTLIWLYRVRENRQPGVVDGSPRAYLLFATGYLPYMADAQYDLSHWSFGNYALGSADLIS
jgi:hypothetical protein